jgi:hypothetical protein
MVSYHTNIEAMPCVNQWLRVHRSVQPGDDIRPAKAPLKLKADGRRELYAMDNDQLASGQLGALAGGGGGGHQMLVRDAHLIGIAKRRDSKLWGRSMIERSR